MKFTSAQGSIEIKVWQQETRLVLHVKDTGVGISPEDIGKLFTRFGKLHRTASINSTGIGLGLTVVKQIVEAANGQIEITSDGVGRGSVVALTLNFEK